jgi:hypothetical protein
MTLKYHPGPDESRRTKRVGAGHRGGGVRHVGGMVIAVALIAAIVALPIGGGAMGWKQYLVGLGVVGVLALMLGVAARRNLARSRARSEERCKLCGQPLSVETSSRDPGGCPECGS